MKDADTQHRDFLGYPSWQWKFAGVFMIVLFGAFMWDESMVKIVLTYFFGTVILFWFLSCIWTLFCGGLNLMGRLFDDP